MIIPKGVILKDLLKYAVKKNITQTGTRVQRRNSLKHNVKEFTKAFRESSEADKNSIISENMGYKGIGE